MLKIVVKVNLIDMKSVVSQMLRNKCYAVVGQKL